MDIEPNSLIPLDDLYWNELEGKYTALSPKEIDTVLQALLNNPEYPSDELDEVDENGVSISRLNDAVKILEWATHVRVGNILLQGVVSGRLEVKLTEESDDPHFAVKDSEENND